MATRRHGSTGLTLVEVLVLLGLLALLVALLLPAIAHNRDTERRLRCRNNLKLLGLALHNYHDAKATFPPGYVANTEVGAANPETLDGPSGFGWGAMISAFVDGKASNPFDTGKPCWDPANTRYATVRLDLFLCPSARHREPFVVQAGTGPMATTTLFSRTHYVANAGEAAPWNASPPQADWTEIATGPFYRNSRVRVGDITDGLSNTVFLGEHADISDRTWVGVVPGAQVCPHDAWHGRCEPAAALTLVTSGPQPGYNGIRPPNADPPCVNQMHSAHSNGCFVLFGDGSVRFISKTIDPATWAPLTTCAGGEEVGGF